MAGITDSGYKEGVEYLPDHPKRQLGDRSKLGKQERRAICMTRRQVLNSVFC